MKRKIEKFSIEDPDNGLSLEGLRNELSLISSYPEEMVRRKYFTKIAYQVRKNEFRGWDDAIEAARFLLDEVATAQEKEGFDPAETLYQAAMVLDETNLSESFLDRKDNELLDIVASQMRAKLPRAYIDTILDMVDRTGTDPNDKPKRKGKFAEIQKEFETYQPTPAEKYFKKWDVLPRGPLKVVFDKERSRKEFKEISEADRDIDNIRANIGDFVDNLLGTRPVNSGDTDRELSSAELLVILQDWEWQDVKDVVDFLCKKVAPLQDKFGKEQRDRWGERRTWTRRSLSILQKARVFLETQSIKRHLRIERNKFGERPKGAPQKDLQGVPKSLLLGDEAMLLVSRILPATRALEGFEEDKQAKQFYIDVFDQVDKSLKEAEAGQAENGAKLLLNLERKYRESIDLKD